MGIHNDDAPPRGGEQRPSQGGGTGDKARPRSGLLLVIENDPTFARIVSDLGIEQALKPVVATRGDVGLAMARQLRPDAIVLDLRLPGLDGWSLLDQFKHDPITRAVPVVIISGDDRWGRARRRGAFDFLLKPVSVEDLRRAIKRLNALAERRERRLLLADTDEARLQEVTDLFAGSHVQMTRAASGAEALSAMEATPFDCVVTAQSLPDMPVKDLITKLARDPSTRDTPVIVRAGGVASELGRLLDVAIVREAPSFDALLEATTLFLHLVDEELAAPNRKLLERLRRANPVLTGKRVLIVDDDARNIFALKALLESQKMDILSAQSGRQGLDMLAREPPVDVVLMDVMMPEMDGYEAIRAIRAVKAWEPLPILALTAKAMKGDRERCIEAGASDYIAKPVDTVQLLSLLRVWLGP